MRICAAQAMTGLECIEVVSASKESFDLGACIVADARLTGVVDEIKFNDGKRFSYGENRFSLRFSLRSSMMLFSCSILLRVVWFSLRLFRTFAASTQTVYVVSKRKNVPNKEIELRHTSSDFWLWNLKIFWSKKKKVLHSFFIACTSFLDAKLGILQRHIHSASKGAENVPRHSIWPKRLNSNNFSHFWQIFHERV